MEKYYFIQQNGVKKGAFKLNELKAENIYFDELVWRSDEDKWKKAGEFEELAGIYLIKPPLTPLDIEKNEIDKEFFKKVIPNTLGIYFMLFLIISISSFLIANSSWEEFKKPYITNQNDVGKNSSIVDDSLVKSYKQKILEDAESLKKMRIESKNPKTAISAMYLLRDISWKEKDSAYYVYLIENKQSNSYNKESIVTPIYSIPESIVSQEEAYSYSQPFLIRPLFAYFSKIYLTREEQNRSVKLFFNITLSTFSLLVLVLIINLLILYIIKGSKTNN
jgi:hypothetical protein